MDELICAESSKRARLSLHAKVPADQFIRIFGLGEFVDDMNDGLLNAVVVADASRALLLASLKVLAECNDALEEQSVSSLDLSFAFMAYAEFFDRKRNQELYAHLLSLTDKNGQLSAVRSAPLPHGVSWPRRGARYNKMVHSIGTKNVYLSDPERFETAKARELELVESAVAVLARKGQLNSFESACSVVTEAGC